VGRTDLVEVPADELRQAREQRLTVIASPPVSLLALSVSNSGVLSNPNLRAALALAVDRSALSNVIFQKQGEITASLLPAELTGYAFLFPTDRDLNKSHELRGGVTPPPLTLAAEGGAAMQLAAQRIALNLRDAGFSVQVVNAAAPQHIDLTLRRLTLESSQPQAGMESILRAAGLAVSISALTPAELYKTEREIVDAHLLIPLLYLPRACAVSGRVRDLRLGAEGTHCWPASRSPMSRRRPRRELRQKLLLLLSLMVAAIVAAVAWTVLVRIRMVFEQRDQKKPPCSSASFSASFSSAPQKSPPP